MLETGFVTHSEYQKHIRGEWRTVHDLWRHIRNYMASYAQPGGFTQGSIAYADADGFLTENNAQFYWDAVNHRLGIGTATPGCALDIEFPTVETVTSRISAETRPWRHWECISGNWGYAFGIHADDKMFHIHYDTPIGNETHGMIHLDGDNVRVGILVDAPGYPLDVGGNTQIQGTFRVTGTTELIGRATLTAGVQGDLDVTGLLTAAGGDFLVAVGDALRVGTGALAADIDFHLGYVTGGNWETYGFYWRYKGSGAGNNNTLQLWAQNQVGAHVKVYEIWQDGAITFSPDVTFGNIAIGAEARFYDNGNYVGFEAPALDADQIWVLPTEDGALGEALVTDGAGNLSWAAGGVATFVALTDTPANYAGAAKKIVRVNAVPDELEFGADIEDLEDVDTLVGQAGKYAKVKVADAGIEWVVGVGAITEFIDLVDTPANYAGAADKIVKVNAVPDGLEFGADIEDLEDVDTLIGQAGKYAKVKVGDAGIEWAEGGGGGGYGTEVIDEDFDALINGVIHGQGVYTGWGAWDTDIEDANCSAEIVANPGNGKMLTLTDNNAAGLVNTRLDADAGHEIVQCLFRCKMRISSFADTDKRGYIGIWDKAARHTGVYFRDSFLKWWTGSATINIVAAAANTWYDVIVFMDCTAAKAVVWVDGVLRITGQSCQTQDIESFTFYTSSPGTGYTVDFDDLLIVDLTRKV